MAASKSITEEGRGLLRSAAVANGQSSDLGNKIADFLDKSGVTVTIKGKVEEAPLRIFGTTPSTPGLNIEPDQEGTVGEDERPPRGSGPLADRGQIGENTPEPLPPTEAEIAEAEAAEKAEEEAEEAAEDAAEEAEDSAEDAEEAAEVPGEEPANKAKSK